MSPTKKTEKTQKQVKATRHKDKRANIPTSQTRKKQKSQAQHPPTLYPRNPDLDPQLVWKGKDQADSQGLEVLTLPTYIQEKIDPQVIVENLRKTQRQSDPAGQLFEDFDGLDTAKQTEFYKHSANWSNRLILGDSLLVMNSLAELENLKGQVQVIFMDPPYGIKFGSNWQVTTRNRTVSDGRDASRQPEQVRAYRDTWKNGIHSYLDYLRDRLVVAKELLHNSGSIFVQIGDENVHLVRCLLDEVMGSENFRSIINIKRAGSYGSTIGLQNTMDFILWYTKDAEYFKENTLYEERNAQHYNQIQLMDGSFRKMTKEEKKGQFSLPDNSRICMDNKLTAQGYTPTCDYPYEFEGNIYYPQSGVSWATSKIGMRNLELTGRLQVVGGRLRYFVFLDEAPGSPLVNSWNDTSGETGATYVVQTPRKVIQRCILMASDPGDLVLDPTCGGGTTAFVAEQWGRRWITIDTSRVALALTRNRLMGAKYPYYKLRDTETCDIRQGFTYKTEPNIKLSTITRCQRLKEGMSRDEIQQILIEDAEKVELVDQPLDNKKIVRVSGPFTVESLSPHRPLEPTGFEQNADNTHFVQVIMENLRRAGIQNTYADERIEFQSLELSPSEEEQQIIAGVGHYVDKRGTDRTVQITIGPEHSTVTPDLVESAYQSAKEAGHNIAAVLGFAFEPEVQQTASQLMKKGASNPRILITKINPDLTMSDSLLKKTDSGNLFIVAGEPDVEIREVTGEMGDTESPPSTSDSASIASSINGTADKQYEIEIKGLDVYDPMTGEVRSSKTDDIACWFIDTNYDEVSFFVRHAYFLGGKDSYKQLKTALKAELNKEIWENLKSATSQPFPAPETGKIAIKVINHYGDEILQTYDLPAK